jgi:hypothetical protein
MAVVNHGGVLSARDEASCVCILSNGSSSGGYWFKPSQFQRYPLLNSSSLSDRLSAQLPFLM